MFKLEEEPVLLDYSFLQRQESIVALHKERNRLISGPHSTGRLRGITRMLVLRLYAVIAMSFLPRICSSYLGKPPCRR